MSRRLMSFFVPAGIAIAAVAAVVVGRGATAQSYDASPEIERLEARMADPGLLFGATIDYAPDDDLLELGRLVAMGGSEKGGAGMACFTCHGANGAGDGSGVFPRLAGLPAWYFYKQLMDYAAGTRPNRIMSGIAANLTEGEMRAVAAYYALVEAPYAEPLGRPSMAELQWGGQLAAIGSTERGIPACVNCHGAQGSGMPPSVPYLAGQHGSYIAHQLHLWKEGVRDNDAMNVMSAIADKMTREDMEAVGAYYERVRPIGGAPDVVVDMDVDVTAPIVPPAPATLR